MGEIRVKGPRPWPSWSWLTPNAVAKLATARSTTPAFLYENGTFVDDLLAASKVDDRNSSWW